MSPDIGDNSLPSGFSFQTRAVHPRLRDSRTIRQLAQIWRDLQWLRIDSALDPGLAAELVAFVPRLAPTPQLDHDRRQLSWRCTVAMPEQVEPQYPACMYRIRRFVCDDLPALASAITGHSLVAASSWVDVHVFRKGSYMDDRRSPSGTVEYALGLTGARWPSAWGGHVELLDDADPAATLERLAPGWDTLDLIGGIGLRMPVIRHHVQGVMICGSLTPEHEVQHPDDAASQPAH